MTNHQECRRVRRRVRGVLATHRAQGRRPLSGDSREAWRNQVSGADVVRVDTGLHEHLDVENACFTGRLNIKPHFQSLVTEVQ